MDGIPSINLEPVGEIATGIKSFYGKHNVTDHGFGALSCVCGWAYNYDPNTPGSDPSSIIEEHQNTITQLSEETMKQMTQQFESGAVRGTDREDVRFDLICPTALRRVAETYAEGAKKYSDNNWCKGIPIKDCLNHAEAHINLWKSGDNSEDHLAHAIWNLMAIIHYGDVCEHHKIYRSGLEFDKAYLENQ